MTTPTHSITLELDTDERLALRRFANEADLPFEDAAQAALRDWLIGHGYLEVPGGDNDNLGQKPSD